MSCCNCGCNTTPCKNISINDIAPLDYVQGVDANGCPKFQSVTTLIPAVHPAATLTNNAAPFSWNATLQTGNIPQVGKLVANADGSYTFTAGDGSAPVVIPKECCPVMSKSGDVVTFTNGDGSVITFTLHPATTLTNNAAAFSWNGTTQTGNIPQSPSLTLTPTGFLFTPGNGAAATVYTEPTDTFISGFTIVGNVATITRNDGTTFTQTVPTTIDINVQSFQLSGSNLVLTETDGTVHTVALPAEVKVNAVSYVPGTGVITITNSDGTSASTTIDTCAALNALPTGAAGVAGTTLFLGKDCEWHTLPAGMVNTPLNANDSSTVNFSTSGADNHTITAAVKVSATQCNMLEVMADGLFVQEMRSPNVLVYNSAPLVTMTNAQLAALTPNAINLVQVMDVVYTNNECYPVEVIGFIRNGNVNLVCEPGTNILVGYSLNALGVPPATAGGQDSASLSNALTGAGGYIETTTPGTYAIRANTVLAPGATYSATMYGTITVKSFNSVMGINTTIIGRATVYLLVFPKP